MTGLSEFRARAALCRQLARLEPGCKYLWLAEADRWSRLEQEPGVEADACHAELAGMSCWNQKAAPFGDFPGSW